MIPALTDHRKTRTVPLIQPTVLVFPQCVEKGPGTFSDQEEVPGPCCFAEDQPLHRTMQVSSWPSTLQTRVVVPLPAMVMRPLASTVATALSVVLQAGVELVPDTRICTVEPLGMVKSVWFRERAALEAPLPEGDILYKPEHLWHRLLLPEPLHF